MLPEEMLFQAFMLTIAVGSLIRAAAVPLATARSAVTPTLRDGKTFRALFAPAGVSWSQYKALSVFALDWMNVTVGDVVEQDEDCVYWLFDGNVQVETPGQPSYSVARQKKQRATGYGETLIGERRLLDHVGAKKKATDGNNDESSFLRVLSAEATVLRINIPGLKELMKNDSDLESAIRSLLFQSMDAKVSSHLMAAQAAQV